MSIISKIRQILGLCNHEWVFVETVNYLEDDGEISKKKQFYQCRHCHRFMRRVLKYYC